MLEVLGVSKSFSGVPIANEIDLTVSSQETVFILGRSGVGKSVLLRLIVGLIPLDAGSVKIRGTEIDFSDQDSVRFLRRKVGLVFQKPALLDSLSVEENLFFGLKEKPNRLTEYLKAVGIDDGDLKKSVQQVSFGTQKKISVLRALLRNPDYLLFDEPTTGLDPISTEAMNQLMLFAVRQSGAGALVVSHDLQSALKYADQILLLESSKIVFKGSPQDFIKSSQDTVMKFCLLQKKGAWVL